MNDPVNKQQEIPYTVYTAACSYRWFEEESVTRLQLFLCAGDLPQFYSGCTLHLQDELQNDTGLFEISLRRGPVFAVNQYSVMKNDDRNGHLCWSKVLKFVCMFIIVVDWWSLNFSETAVKCIKCGQENVFECVFSTWPCVALVGAAKTFECVQSLCLLCLLFSPNKPLYVCVV